MRNTGRRGEARAAQNLVRGEPGLGVLLVRVAQKAGIRQEGARGPFPDMTYVLQPRQRRAFPFRLGWQSPAGEGAKSVRLVPTDMPDGLFVRDRNPAIEASHLAALPIERFLAGVLDELAKLPIGHRPTRHAEGLEHHRMTPFFV